MSLHLQESAEVRDGLPRNSDCALRPHLAHVRDHFLHGHRPAGSSDDRASPIGPAVLDERFVYTDGIRTDTRRLPTTDLHPRLTALAIGRPVGSPAGPKVGAVVAHQRLGTPYRPKAGHVLIKSHGSRYVDVEEVRIASTHALEDPVSVALQTTVCLDKAWSDDSGATLEARSALQTGKHRRSLPLGEQIVRRQPFTGGRRSRRGDQRSERHQRHRYRQQPSHESPVIPRCQEGIKLRRGTGCCKIWFARPSSAASTAVSKSPTTPCEWSNVNVARGEMRLPAMRERVQALPSIRGREGSLPVQGLSMERLVERHVCET